MINKIKFFTLLSLIILFQSCTSNDNDEYVNMPKSIYEHVATSMNYSYLRYALEKTNLDGVLNGVEKYTLYAPNNMAFGRFLMSAGYNDIDKVPTSLLTQVLLNHVMVGEMEYRDFKTGYFNTAAVSDASNTPMSIHIQQINMRVTLNGEARITQGNVRATNGIIHVVDRVIPIPTIVTFALADQNLGSLLSALTRSDLTTDFASILSTDPGISPAPFTVFAPTNQAFDDLLNELGVSRLGAIDEPTLKSTLTYHVLAETNALSTDLSDNLELDTLGGPVTANITGGATITVGNNRKSKIIAVDVQANNGVVHLIDKVILPN
jgi:transforming growth factor-beta-induced protein